MSTIYSRCIDRLRNHGWKRRAYGNENTGYCLLGSARAEHEAVSPFISEIEVGVHAYSVLAERGAFRKAFGSPRCTYDQLLAVAWWNDNCAKDVDEVIEVLKLAGERAALEAEK